MLEQQQTISFSDYSSLYDLIIPKDNLLRQITDLVDFSFVYHNYRTSIVMTMVVQQRVLSVCLSISF